MRDALKRNGADAIDSFLGHSRPGELVGGIPITDPVRVWFARKSAAMLECREVRAFREAQCGQYEIVPVSCRVRICPDCERARSAKMLRQVAAIVAEQIPRGRGSMLTLTIRNTLELREGFRRLDRAYTSLRHRALFRGGRCRSRGRGGQPMHPCGAAFCSRWSARRHRGDRNCPDFRHQAVRGGARFDEVTFNLGARTWHPHAHLILDAPFILQAELADTWRAITCPNPKHRRAGWCPRECDEGSPIVDIRAVKAGTLREVVKYVTKVTDLLEGDDPMQLIEFLIATRDRRMVRCFGSFYGLELLEDESPEASVTKVVATGDHDRAGRPITLRFKLPRFCRQCGRDTDLGDDCTYENPVPADRRDLQLRNGFLSWRPRPRAPAG